MSACCTCGAIGLQVRVAAGSADSPWHHLNGHAGSFALQLLCVRAAAVRSTSRSNEARRSHAANRDHRLSRCWETPLQLHHYTIRRSMIHQKHSSRKPKKYGDCSSGRQPDRTLGKRLWLRCPNGLCCAAGSIAISSVNQGLIRESGGCCCVGVRRGWCSLLEFPICLSYS